jgi:hypothetical protein
VQIDLNSADVIHSTPRSYHLQGLAHAIFLQDPQDCDRVGRADEGSEDQRPCKVLLRFVVLGGGDGCEPAAGRDRAPGRRPVAPSQRLLCARRGGPPDRRHP